MGFDTLTCIVLYCDDDCDEPWGDEGVPHFDSETDAIEYARNCGWIVTAGKAWCGDCAAKRACEATAHKWMEWGPLELDGVTWRSRHCENCSESESDPSHQALLTLLDAAKVLNAVGGSDV